MSHLYSEEYEDVGVANVFGRREMMAMLDAKKSPTHTHHVLAHMPTHNAVKWSRAPTIGGGMR